MTTKTKFAIITVVFAVIAFILGRVIWPDVPGIGMPAPTASQLPLFIFLSLLESVSFGIGIAFATLGWKYMKALMPEKKGAVWSFVAITWLLVSWWPHDNMHRVNGLDMGGLLRIEYTFHLTLILAGLIVAWNFWKWIKPEVS